MSEFYQCDRWRFHFNELVVMEMLVGAKDEHRIGRLVQVRKRVGAFNSDVYLIRRRDGSLMSFSNVMIRPANDARFEEAFYRSNDRTPPFVHPESEYPKDDPDAEYTMSGEYPETGFVIEHPSQPDDPIQSCAMIVTMGRKEGR